MDLSRYKVKGVNDTSFRAAFTSMMDVNVQSIVRLRSIRNQIPNVDNCNFPVGFVYFEQGVYYLVGWLPNAKKVHPSGLKPWAKEEVVLYGKYIKRTWTNGLLYGAVQRRMQYINDETAIIAGSVTNWENTRHALYMYAVLLDRTDTLVKKEIEMLKRILTDNDPLRATICEKLSIAQDALWDYMATLYKRKLTFENEQELRNNGIMEMVKTQFDKWRV